MLSTLNLQNLLVLDIETVPQYKTFEEVPSNFKKLWEEKTKYQRKDEQTAEEFYPRAGIWAEFGKIVCISVGIFKDDENLRVKSFFGHDERLLLQHFTILLNTQAKNLILGAHNGKEFDFPYLCRRMLINDLKIPLQLDIAGKKPWETNHIDTLDLWKFGDYKNYTSLNLLAAIFNIPTPKDDIDGSQVSEIYWQNNDLERIKNYCQKDVVTTCRIIQRFKGLKMLSNQNITLVD